MKSSKRRAAPAASEVPANAAPASSSRRPSASGDPSKWICVGLAVITLLLYWRTVSFEILNFDDMDYVVDSPWVKQGLTAESVKWAFTGTQVANWHPLTTLSLLANSHLFGMKPASFHAVNVLLHAANVVLAFLVFRRLTGAVWRSAMVAALFAWHPLHVESVAWISERKDVLSGLFWLATTWFYAGWVRHARRRDYGLALTMFALGLLSKPMVVTLPFVFLLLDVWPLNRLARGGQAGKTWSQLTLEKVPFFAICAVGSVVTFLTQKHTGAVAQVTVFPWSERLINAVISYARYVEKTVWPADLAVFYPYPTRWLADRIGWSVILVLGISAAAWWLGRRREYLRIGWFWFLGTLVPVIGLVQVGSQSMADRYMYLPQFGLFVMAVWGAHEWMSRHKLGAQGMGGLAAVVLAACAGVTWKQTAHWRDSITLFEHAIKATGRNEFAQTILGNAYVMKGRLEEGARHYEESIRLMPKDYAVHYKLASVLAKLGRAEPAMKAFEGVLRLKPDHYESHYNLGGIYFQLNNKEKAVEHYTEAARLRPANFDLLFNLATVHLAGAQYGPAAEHYLAALKLNPASETARQHVAHALVQTGRAEEAVAQYEALLRLNATSMPGLLGLGWIRAAQGDARLRNGAEAVRLAEKANELTGRSDPQAVDLLAAAYAEAGRFPEAVAAAQALVTAAEGKQPPAAVAAMRQRLEAYQQGKAWRRP